VTVWERGANAPAQACKCRGPDASAGQIFYTGIFGNPYLHRLHLHRHRPATPPLSTAHAESHNLRTLMAVIDTPGQRAESAIGAISEDGGAQRPLTYCDSYRLPDMLLVACRSRLRVVGF
jgi:hypothetical protein